MSRAAKYWLLKTEPDEFSIDDLADAPDQTTCWDGVRNYQARNFMRDEMQPGDPVLIYHSGTSEPAVVGVAEVAGEAYPDHSSWDEGDDHYDPKSTRENPRWFMVDVKFVRKFAAPLALQSLRGVKSLAEMELLRKGSRLSVQPVRKKEFEAILKLAKS